MTGAAVPMSASQDLADWVSALRWTDIPAEQQPLFGMRVLDTLGLILAGSQTEAAAAVRSIVRKQGVSDEAGILPGGGRAAAAWAAFAHGVTAHCRDFDDTFQDSVVHPGSTVVSTALAVGEAMKADDTDIATAVAAGYEVAARLGSVAGRRFHRRGLHATGIVGPFAAAATAGRLLKLDGRAMADAFGLAGSMASGLMAFIADGSWSKWLHAGWAAHGGIVAAQMAAEGFRGPAGVLDGRHNLYVSLLAGEDVDAPALTERLGDHWAGAEAHFKYYPCAHVIQPYLDAAIDFRAALGLTGADVAGGVCRIAPWAARIVSVPREAKIRPDTEMAAIASLPYLLAVALHHGSVTLDALGDAARTNPAVLNLAARLVHEEDPSLGDGFDGVLVLELAGAEKGAEKMERPVSSAPPSMDKLIAKYRANSSRTTAGDKIAELEAAAIEAPLPDFKSIFALIQRW